MNCKEAHFIIAGLTGHELPENLTAHIQDCRACADLLAMDVRLRATLQSHHPVASPYVLGRIRQEIAVPVKQPWFESLRKNSLMKITLPALTALAIAAALVSLPRPASAATAVSAFRNMKKAVLAHAKQMTQLELHVGKTSNGSLGTWVVLDGDLTQLNPNGTFHTKKDGKEIVVKTSMSAHGPDLSTLTPDQQAMVKKAIQNALDGKGVGSSVSTKYIVNGKEVDASTAQSAMQQAGLSFSLDIDLNEADYNSIVFGADHDHLVLRSKKTTNRRTILTLDPKSNLPKSVKLEQNVHGKWIEIKQSAITL